jgi:3-hydroxymyristoyl/3-hydroxydecanoyl-(acyl carrier protein) dehydratase
LSGSWVSLQEQNVSPNAWVRTRRFVVPPVLSGVIGYEVG